MGDYGDPAPTNPSFIRPQYVRYNSFSKAKDLGTQDDLLIIVTGVIGGEAGAHTLYFKVKVDGPSRLGIRTPFLTEQQARWISVGLLDAQREQVPLDDEGFGIPPLRPYSDTSEATTLLAPGEYYFTVSTNQWPEEELEVQMAILKPTILDGEILLELEVNGVAIGIDVGMILDGPIELQLETEGTALAIGSALIFSADVDLDLDVTGTIQQPLHGLLELELELEGELFSGVALLPAEILVIGNPKFSLGASDPHMPLYPPDTTFYSEFFNCQGVVYHPTAAGGQPGYITMTGGRTARDEAFFGGQADQPYTDVACYTLDLEPSWRIATHATNGATYQAYILGGDYVVVTPDGTIFASAGERYLPSPPVVEEFVVVSPSGLLSSRRAYSGGAYLSDMIYMHAALTTFLLHFDFSACYIATISNVDYSAGWAYVYSIPPSNPSYADLSGVQLAISANYARLYVFGTCSNVAVPPSYFSGYYPLFMELDTLGNVVDSYVLLDATPGAPALQETAFNGGIEEDDDHLLVYGNTLRTDYLGEYDFFIARIHRGTRVVENAVVFSNPSSSYIYGINYNNCTCLLDDNGDIIVVSGGYYDGYAPDGYGELCAIHRLSSEFEPLGSNYVSCSSEYGSTESKSKIIDGKLVIVTSMGGGSWGPPGAGNGLIQDSLLIRLDPAAIGYQATGFYGDAAHPDQGRIHISDITSAVSVLPITLVASPITLNRATYPWSSTSSIYTNSSREPDYAVLESLPPPNWVYSQSSVHPDCQAASYYGMANGSVYSPNQTSTNADPSGSWLQVMFDSLIFVASIDVGCDYWDTLPAGVYPNVLVTPRIAYSENCNIQITLDGTIWSTVANTGIVSSAITSYPIALGVLGIRITSAPPAGATAGQLVVTEFKPIL